MSNLNSCGRVLVVAFSIVHLECSAYGAPVPTACESPAPLIGQEEPESTWYDVMLREDEVLVKAVPALETRVGFNLDEYWKKSPHEFNVELTPEQVASLRCDAVVTSVAYAKSRARGGKPKMRQVSENRVMLLLTVGVDGKVTNVEITQPSGFPTVDEAARNHVLKNYKLEPFVKQGKPIESKFQLPIVFKVEELEP